MPKIKQVFQCSSCGYQTGRWLGKCPECDTWNSFSEFTEEKKIGEIISVFSKQVPQRLTDIENTYDKRIKTGSTELDRVLSGGIVKGSLVLISGDPGIGKSTLLLQICQSIGDSHIKILYVSGEESASQIKMRAERLGITSNNLYILPETNISYISESINEINPGLLIIDSIQTMFTQEIPQAPGTVTQVRGSTTAFMRIGKSMNIPIIIVGHATKDGAIAGPRILEHMVDAVLYFEGERYLSLRILRAVKNRFGSTNETGVFEMQEKGLIDIANPSQYLLSGRPENQPGSVLTSIIEGSRAIITEVQALVSTTTFAMPRRTATGVDLNRVYLIIAVLEKKLGLKLGTMDIYINIAGGMKVTDTSVDAAIATAILSSYRNVSLNKYAMVFGEIGLAGEIRSVSQSEKRIIESCKMGFDFCVFPNEDLISLNKSGLLLKHKCNAQGVKNVSELANKLLN